MITKLHASILNIHGIVGEKEASGWLKETQKASSSTSQSKTPVKKLPAPTTRKTAAAAAAATTVEESGSGEGGLPGQNEKDLLKEVLKPQYVHLLEMDELVREKLFILQVKDLHC
jgi:hypothetical protein